MERDPVSGENELCGRINRRKFLPDSSNSFIAPGLYVQVLRSTFPKVDQPRIQIFIVLV